jgi:hypothetical protein
VTALSVEIARAEALFASTLSACEPHDAAELRAAIAAAVRAEHGVAGCAAVVAQEFGDRGGADAVGAGRRTAAR